MCPLTFTPFNIKSMEKSKYIVIFNFHTIYIVEFNVNRKNITQECYHIPSNAFT